MEFVIDCKCGRTITVSMGSAGARIPCVCGDFFNVPSLGDLRKSMGLPAVEVPMEVEVNHQIESGELPMPTCIGCGAAGADVVEYVAECEQMIYGNSNTASAVEKTVLFALSVLVVALSPEMMLMEDEAPSEPRGRDLSIPVPARVCDHCLHSQFSPPRTGLWKIIGASLAIAGIAGMFWAPWLDFSISMMATVAGGLLYAFEYRLPNGYQKRIRRGLSEVPIYQRIFQKYPDAAVSVGTVRNRSGF